MPTKPKKKIAFILGIRPDIIRAALILRYLRKEPEIETVFIWSGQHYSDNLKGIFLRELEVPEPDFDLGCGGETDAEVAASGIAKLYPVLQQIKPDVAVFLGDTNTVISSLAAAQLNIPIVHIEGGMRSYDWRMPEEKYRTTVDHLADKIYAYFDEYKEQAVREGINPKNVVVVGNPIVDILNEFYFGQKEKFDKMASPEFFQKKKLEKDQYYFLTWHRRENVEIPASFDAILNLLKHSPYPIYFPASYRTQRIIKERNITLPQQVQMVDPIGYEEMLVLVTNARGVLTDSGTVIEETCVLQVPAIQMRRSTERPQVYDVKAAVKFDPTQPEKYSSELVFQKLESLHGKSWSNPLGDGKTSERIAKDLIQRVLSNTIGGHRPEDSHLPISRSYREDEIIP